MGPPIFIGGNDEQDPNAEEEKQLQWGRRFSSAEMLSTDTSQSGPRSFNGAADFHRRKSGQ